MNLKCWAYRALERYRFSTLGAKLSYGGQRVQLKGQRTIIGTVIRAPQNEYDGDCTFDVLTETGTFHCELTPCQSLAMHVAARSLQVGWRVSIGGIERYDPAHLGGPARQEIHPVTRIVRVL